MCAAAALLAGGCGGESGASAPAAVRVQVAGFRFLPERATVKAGGTVTWINRDKAPHTATRDDGFDTHRLGQGESGPVTLDEPGTYTYYCTFHRFMTATVVVVEE